MIKLTLLALAATPAAFLLQDAPSTETQKEVQVVITSAGIQEAGPGSDCCEEGGKDADCSEAGECATAECEIEVVAEIVQDGKKPRRLKKRNVWPFGGGKMMKMGDGAHAFMISGEPGEMGDIDIQAILQQVEGMDIEGLDLGAMLQGHGMPGHGGGEGPQVKCQATRFEWRADKDEECGEWRGQCEERGGDECHGSKGMKGGHGGMMRGHGGMNGGHGRMMRGHGGMKGGHGDMMRGHGGMKGGHGDMMPVMQHGMDAMHEALEIIMEAPEAFEELEDDIDDLEDRMRDMQDQLDRIERLLRNPRRGGR